MKICLITDNFFPILGGVANVLENLYKEFLKTDHTLYVINPLSQNGNIFKILRNTQFSIKEFYIFLKNKNFYKNLVCVCWYVIQDKKISFKNKMSILLYLFTKPKLFMKIMNNIESLYPFLKRLEFDILLVGHSGWLLPLGFILSRILKKKLITMAYGNDFLIRSPLTLKTYYFRNTDKIIVINHQMKEIIKAMHHLSEKQLEVIYVGLNLNDLDVKETKKELRKSFNIPEDEFVILSVGRHVSRKKFDLVMKTVRDYRMRISLRKKTV